MLLELYHDFQVQLLDLSLLSLKLGQILVHEPEKTLLRHYVELVVEELQIVRQQLANRWNIGLWKAGEFEGLLM